MDTAYVSAIAALAGSMIGGLTSLATSWLTHHTQFRAQQVTHDVTRREDLYKDFIVEASRLYADAYGGNDTEAAKLVPLASLICLMRVISSPEIVDSAERVVQSILATYQAPNRSSHDLQDFLNSDAVDPLRHFSNACRVELRRFGAR